MLFYTMFTINSFLREAEILNCPLKVFTISLKYQAVMKQSQTLQDFRIFLLRPPTAHMPKSGRCRSTNFPLMALAE